VAHIMSARIVNLLAAAVCLVILINVPSYA
jgi:hypothetical protein